MGVSKEEWIGKRAYSLWEAAGRPFGQDHEHWSQASVEYLALERSTASSDGSEILRSFYERQGHAERPDPEETVWSLA